MITMPLEPPTGYRREEVRSHPKYGDIEIFVQKRSDMRHMYKIGVFYFDRVILSKASLDPSECIADLEWRLKQMG